MLLPGILAAVLTIAGLALTFFVPKLSVEARGSFRPLKPMGLALFLSNEGVLPVHDVSSVCVVQTLSKRGVLHKIPVASPKPDADILSPGHKMTLPLCEMDTLNTTEADIVIRVRYRPEFVPWHTNKVFRKHAKQADGGTWICTDEAK